MALCKWCDGEACNKEAKHPSGTCEMHRKMTPTIVDSLAAGVIGTEHYGLYSSNVFLIDALGQKHEVQKALADKVRAAIQAGAEIKPDELVGEK